MACAGAEGMPGTSHSGGQSQYRRSTKRDLQRSDWLRQETTITLESCRTRDNRRHTTQDNRYNHQYFVIPHPI